MTNRQATHFEFICEMIPELLDVAKKLQPGIILNVNAPDLPKWQIKGVRYADAGICGFNNTFERVIEENSDNADEEKANKPFADGEYKYNGELLMVVPSHQIQILTALQKDMRPSLRTR